MLLWTDWPRKMDVENKEFWTTGPFTTASGWPQRPSRAEHTTHAMFFLAGITVIESSLVDRSRIVRGAKDRVSRFA